MKPQAGELNTICGHGMALYLRTINMERLVKAVI